MRRERLAQGFSEVPARAKYLITNCLGFNGCLLTMTCMGCAPDLFEEGAIEHEPVPSSSISGYVSARRGHGTARIG